MCVCVCVGGGTLMVFDNPPTQIFSFDLTAIPRGRLPSPFQFFFLPAADAVVVGSVKVSLVQL